MAGMPEAQVIFQNVKDNLEELNKMERLSLQRNENLLQQLSDLEKYLKESSLMTKNLKVMREEALTEVRQMDSYQHLRCSMQQNYKNTQKQWMPRVEPDLLPSTVGESRLMLPVRMEASLMNDPMLFSKLFTNSGGPKPERGTGVLKNVRNTAVPKKFKSLQPNSKLENSIQSLFKSYHSSVCPKTSTPVHKKVKTTSDISSGFKNMRLLNKSSAIPKVVSAVSITSDKTSVLKSHPLKTTTLPVAGDLNLKENLIQKSVRSQSSTNNAYEPLTEVMNVSRNRADHKTGENVNETNSSWLIYEPDQQADSRNEASRLALGTMQPIASDGCSDVLKDESNGNIKQWERSLKMSLGDVLPKTTYKKQQSESVTEINLIHSLDNGPSETYFQQVDDSIAMGYIDQKISNEDDSETSEPSLIIAPTPVDAENVELKCSDCAIVLKPELKSVLSDSIREEIPQQQQQSTMLNIKPSDNLPSATATQSMESVKDAEPLIIEQPESVTDSDKLEAAENGHMMISNLTNPVLQKSASVADDDDVRPSQKMGTSPEKTSQEGHSHGQKHTNIVVQEITDAHQDKSEGILNFLSSDQYDENEDEDSFFEFSQPKASGQDLLHLKSSTVTNISQKSDEASDNENGDIEQQLAHIIAGPAPSRNIAQKEPESEMQSALTTTTTMNKNITPQHLPHKSAKESTIQIPEKKSVTHHLAEKLAIHLGLSSSEDLNAIHSEKEQDEDDFDFYD